MSRKDYEAIAAAIREEYDAWAAEGDSGTAGTTALATAAENIADALAADNPRFDREKFLNAALGDQ